MTTGRAALIVLGKELRLEFRTKELLNTTVFFALVVVALFSFAFQPTTAETRRIAPGLLWVAFFFSGSLMLQPCFVREQTNDTLAALRLAPVDPFGILLGKILANLLFLSIAELVLLPIFSVLYNVGLLAVLGPLLLVLLLGTLGLVTTGTVFAAMAAQARLRELLLPLLLLPVLTPVLIASVEITAGLLARPSSLETEWLAFLVGFDIIFLTASWLLCGYLVEE